MNSTRLVRLSIMLASLAFHSGQSWADLLQRAQSSEYSTDDAIGLAEDGVDKGKDQTGETLALKLTPTLGETSAPLVNESTNHMKSPEGGPINLASNPGESLKLKVTEQLNSLNSIAQTGKSGKMFTGEFTRLGNSVKNWTDLWHSSYASQFSTDYAVNPGLLPGISTGVWLNTISPNYVLTRIDGADQFKVGGTLNIVKSSNLTQSVNRTDPSVFINWLRQNNTGEFGISTGYEQNATRQATGPITQFFIDSTINTRTLSANWSKALSERSTLSSSGAYSGVSYTGGVNYTDYSTRSLTLNSSYDLSENLAPFVSVSYSDLEPTGGLSTRRINPMAGLKLVISERLDTSLQAGKSKVIGASGDSAQFALSVQYKGERSGLTLNADHTTTPSGLGNFITATHDTGEWFYDLSERSKAGISLTWTRYLSITNDAYGTLDTWLQHDIDAVWGMRMHFSRRIHNGGVIGSASSNVLGISLNYSHSDF